MLQLHARHCSLRNKHHLFLLSLIFDCRIRKLQIIGFRWISSVFSIKFPQQIRLQVRRRASEHKPSSSSNMKQQTKMDTTGKVPCITATIRTALFYPGLVWWGKVDELNIILIQWRREMFLLCIGGNSKTWALSRLSASSLSYQQLVISKKRKRIVNAEKSFCNHV